jgi:hypothetical protein
MTGPEHYREAERLLDTATDNDGDIQTDDGMTANILTAAQVHATLALAAATAIPLVPAHVLAEMKAWSDVAGTPGQDYDVLDSIA